jgi:hydrogenase expression/formation protein HypC
MEEREIEGLRFGTVRFGGVTRQACLDFVPEARCGDYVIVHVGFAISRVDAEEAERTYRLLEEMEALEGEPGGLEDELGKDGG